MELRICQSKSCHYRDIVGYACCYWHWLKVVSGAKVLQLQTKQLYFFTELNWTEPNWTELCANKWNFKNFNFCSTTTLFVFLVTKNGNGHSLFFLTSKLWWTKWYDSPSSLWVYPWHWHLPFLGVTLRVGDELFNVKKGFNLVLC